MLYSIDLVTEHMDLLFEISLSDRPALENDVVGTQIMIQIANIGLVTLLFIPGHTPNELYQQLF